MRPDRAGRRTFRTAPARSRSVGDCRRGQQRPTAGARGRGCGKRDMSAVRHCARAPRTR